MSKSLTARRVALLSSSSLGLAAIASAASLTTTLAPTAALAADECGVQSGSTPLVCSAAAYAGGVTYDANGNLVVTFTPTTSNIGGNGVVLTGSGSESITFDSATTNTELQSSSLVGALLDVSTVNGAIDISTEEMDADGLSPAGVTHAIRAISSGSGDVSVTTTGTVDTDSSANPIDSIGIEARSLGGGDVAIATDGTVSGRLRSILASSSGTGGASLILNGSASGGGVEVSSGAGGFDVQINSGTTTLLQTSGPAGGDILVGPTAVLRAADTSTTAGSVTTIVVEGRLQVSGSNTVAHTASGAGDVVLTLIDSGNEERNRGSMSGHVDYSALTGSSTVNIESRLIFNGWQLPAGTSIFGTGDDEINVGATGFMGNRAVSTTLDFNDGEDVINNAGAFAAGDQTAGASELTLVNLSAFHNSGLILLGGNVGLALNKNNAQSDLEVDDRFTLRDSRFVGEEGSRIYLDAILGATTQSSCATLTAADCLDFQGTTTEGLTLLRVRDASPSFDGFRNDGILLIDVAGGASSADHFELDPASIGYDEDAVLGPVIRKGLIAYDLIYDEDAEQHVLVGVVAPEAYQFQFIPGVALNSWRTTTGTWFDRQADLRDTLGGPGLSKGMWARAAADFTGRDVGADFQLRGETVTFDQSHNQKTGAVVVGADLVSAESDSQGVVFGAMLGFMNSTTEFDESLTRMEFTGPTGGLYASYVAGGLFLDGVVNASLLNMNQDAPGLNLGEGVRLEQDITMVGGQVEGGWRTRLGGGVFVEPLAAVSYVRTQFEDIETSGSTVDFADEAASFRGALGVRAGLDAAYGAARVSYTVTGRAWNEFEGENPLVLELPGESMAMTDDLSGTFGEVGAGVSLSDDTGLVSGFLNGNYKFQKDYRSAGFSAGVRLRW